MPTSERQRLEKCGGMIELKHNRMAMARAIKRFRPEEGKAITEYVRQARQANRQAVRLWYGRGKQGMTPDDMIDLSTVILQRSPSDRNTHFLDACAIADDVVAYFGMDNPLYPKT